ncbi:MAG: alpha/beta fold hydrolase [Patescibacteria group bacterium]
MEPYNPKQIEKKWQQHWEEHKTFEVTEDPSKQKFYGLIEFPYPSGEGLHVGHPRPFTAMDVIARKKRMEGYNVLFPIGFDAFGLPTENYAIKTGRPPAEVTRENISNFTRQLKMLGYSFDWSRAVETTDPAYYRWTQWIFLQLFKHGLAYKKAMPINWCLSCKIGLANEEVVDGKCERCGGEIEKRNKEQWMLAITKYADSLLAGLNDVDYIERAKVQQRNWIGRSEGASVRFQISDFRFQIEVFTTRPDTLFGATYMVLAPENKLIEDLRLKIENWEEVKKYIEEAKRKSDLERTSLEKEKTGVELKGIKAVNPVNGEKIPVWVADYVLAGYGTGAIMAVPAHDERDWEFAKKYDLPIKHVVARQIGERKKEGYSRPGVYAIITRGDRILVMFDKKNKYYRIPGGGMDKGDGDKLETLKREIEEETGFKNYQIGDQFSTLEACSYATDSVQYQHRLLHVYHVSLSDDKKKSNHLEEGKWDYHWMTFEEAQKAFAKNAQEIGEIELIALAFGKETECFSGEGVSINSEFLNNLETKDAKEKMISWLEEKGLGKREVNYKLRDWVFSRQRYWGEPIPLVYCEHCKNKKYKYILLHGFGASSQEIFIPRLKAKLESEGHEVFAPDLPNTDNPDIAEQAKFVLDNTKITEDTIIVASSLGSIVTWKLLEKIKTKITKAVIVDGFIRPEFNDRKRPAVEKSGDFKFDWKKIKNNVDEFVILADNQFPIIPEEQSRETRELLDASLQFAKPEYPHFVGAEEPEIERILENTGWIPLPEDQLPLELPKVVKYQPTDTGESPLAVIDDWVNTTCPKCGGSAQRETDTMPNWAGSSWYFLRYMDPKNSKELAAQDKLKYWGPIDWYNGGMEHTVLHLLYSRFWNQFLFDIGAVPFKEPYKKRTSHGMILAKGGEKMSKSRGNVVNPDEMVEKFGVDALRTYIMFMGPFDQAVEWDTNGLIGVRRFFDRVWSLQTKVEGVKDQKLEIGNWKLENILHKTIKKVTEDIEAMRFNTAIAKMMELSNEMGRHEQLPIINYQLLISILSPFAPHLCAELWEKYGEGEMTWPKYDPEKIVEDEITVVVQINGKVRDELRVPVDISEEEVKKMALESEKVGKWLEGRGVKKVIYVKGRLVSIVV